MSEVKTDTLAEVPSSTGQVPKRAISLETSGNLLSAYGWNALLELSFIPLAPAVLALIGSVAFRRGGASA